MPAQGCTDDSDLGSWRECYYPGFEVSVAYKGPEGECREGEWCYPDIGFPHALGHRRHRRRSLTGQLILRQLRYPLNHFD
jgi:hypothetical protein